jgi:hypothetical protein
LRILRKKIIFHPLRGIQRDLLHVF